MESFRQFIEEHEFVDFVINEFNAPMPQKVKPWSAKKDQILDIWKNLRPDVPIFMTPVAKKEDGGQSSYAEDGVRITGSYQFISAVLGKLKELMAYENPNTKLRLVFRGVDASKSGPNKKAYVFYANLENRARRLKGIAGT